jgi:chemotaxis protein MotB
MAKNDTAPIIIKKVKKVSGGGHHGGAWKVAYADFVTAMMAFFLLLWLLNVTTDEQKRGIADYFSPASLARQTSGSGGVLGGTTLSPEGAMTSQRSQVGLTLVMPSSETESATQGPQDGAADEEQLDELLARREEEQFATAEEALRQAIQTVPELQALSKNLLIDRTPEGMRIQIVDQAGKSMFPIGRAEMYDHTAQLLTLVADAIAQLPQKILIKGHTDATPYVTDNGYSNWELSTDRANSSRRALVRAGLTPERIDSVAGRADQEPLKPDQPFDPQNRRISIILLRENPQAKGAAAPSRGSG